MMLLRLIQILEAPRPSTVKVEELRNARHIRTRFAKTHFQNGK